MSTSFRGIKSRPIWQDRSTLNIPWQYYAMTLQLSDVAESGWRAGGRSKHPRGRCRELPDRRPGWREGYARRVLVARCLVDHALHASGDIWGEHTAINQLGERRFRGSVVDLLYDRAERLRAGDFWRQRREVPVGAPLRWYTLVDHEVCPALQLRSQILPRHKVLKMSSSRSVTPATFTIAASPPVVPGSFWFTLASLTLQASSTIPPEWDDNSSCARRRGRNSGRASGCNLQ